MVCCNVNSGLEAENSKSKFDPDMEEEEEVKMDVLNELEPDMSVKVLSYLDKPKELVRASCVSCTWHNIAVENGLCKMLCLRLHPQLSRVSHVVELNNPDAKECAEAGSSNSKEWDMLETEHRVYAFLAHACTFFPDRDCIAEAISASSTDNYPEESIHNTLDPRDVIDRRASYWSSRGHTNAAVPEMLTYKLKSDLVLITEISIHPFQAYFQHGLPIYSASGVRFHLGHAKIPIDVEGDFMNESSHDDKFEWTYTSQVFPMAQENRLQTFELPKPVLCIGGIMQIELVGRVQRQEMDDKFYICVSHVQVKGKLLGPAFSVEINVPSGLFVLKRLTKFNRPSLPEAESDGISTGDSERRFRHMLPNMDVLRENVVDFDRYFEWDDADDDETDEDEEYMD